ncbi:MAG: DUF1552 domain-containing protein [Deltaproteobacteria bacterium]|nr:DUF1552 domain-containing protein [Deltaproteobacteria bacterium]
MSLMSRRRFLFGAGAAVAIPYLESLGPRVARAATTPKRFVVFYVPNGIQASDWKPENRGPELELAPALEPLRSLQSKLTLISGLANAPAQRDEDGAHARGTGSFLTSTAILRSEDRLENGVSVDQLIARGNPDSRFPSLELGIDGGAFSGSCDSGYSCAYQRSLAWSGPSSPLPKIITPRVLFERLFGGTSVARTALDRARKSRQAASVLDSVRADAKSLSAELSSPDRRKLDEYLTSLRELEQRIFAPPTDVCSVPELGPPPNRDIPRHVREMSELMVAALRCDLTRVVTFMLATSGSNRSYSFMGVDGDHHDLSHHGRDADKLQKLRRIATWEVEQLAYLCRRMDEVEEGDGTLLDHSLVYCSSEISDGDLHNADDLPVILLGRAGGALCAGRHVRARDREPLANLYLTFLRYFDRPESRFGDDGTHELSELA